MKTALLTFSIIVVLGLIGGAVLFTQKNNTGGEPVNNVRMVEGTQVIEISAKGGYSPRVTVAQANVQTVLKVKTQGTFDCSAALVIPSIGYEKLLQPSGEEEITLPPQKPGTTLQGLCSMGMYNFRVEFN